MHRRSLVLILLLLGISSAPAMLGCAGPPRRSVFSGDDADHTAPPSPPSRTPGSTAPEPSPADGARLVSVAEQYLGTPYRYGGNTARGMDCSGLVQTVFGQEGMTLPRSCAAQARQGTPVERDELREGDLVFFGKSGAPPSHVGIYVGNGRFIHASTSKGKVRRDKLSTSWFREHYRSARRILPAASTVSSNTPSS